MGRDDGKRMRKITGGTHYNVTTAPVVLVCVCVCLGTHIQIY